MSTLKDKLASSVRQAKSAAQPAAVAPRAATPAAPAPARAAAAATAHRSSADAQNPAPSTRELFPRRVWPD